MIALVDPLPGTSQPCPTCVTYWRRRSHVLAPAIAAAARRRKASYPEVAAAFFVGVHERHLSGLPLQDRPQLSFGRVAALMGLLSELIANEEVAEP